MISLRKINIYNKKVIQIWLSSTRSMVYGLWYAWKIITTQFNLMNILKSATKMSKKEGSKKRLVFFMLVYLIKHYRASKFHYSKVLV